MRMFIVTILSALLVTSCSVLSPIKTEPEATYELNAVPSASIKKSRKPITLLVMPVEATPPYNSTQMAYTIKPYETRYFAKNRWTTSPANMLQPLIVQTLQNTQYFTGVVAPSFTGHYDYALNLQLLELQQDFLHNPSVIRLTLRAQLINSTSGKVIATQQFTIKKAAPQNTPYAGVIAANEATKTFLQELARFCLKAT